MGVSHDALQRSANIPFHIDRASPRKLRDAGPLRPAVNVAFATVVMYYQERVDAHEMEAATLALRAAMVEGGCCTNSDVDTLNTQWGQVDKPRKISLPWST